MPAKGGSRKAKGKPMAQQAAPATAQVDASLPDWPPLQPVLPASVLSVENTLQDHIIVVPNLFTTTLCKNYVSFLSTLPLVTTPGKPKRGEALRVNDRYQIEDANFAARLWQDTAIKDIVASYPDMAIWGGEVLGLNSRIRVYRYTPGQYFDQHYDESNRVEFGPDRIPGKTTWTLLIYLTSCEGGETAFYPEAVNKKDATPQPVVVDPRTGSALFHRHFPECLLHEGKEVKSGEKWVLRSDLVVRR